MLELCLKWGEGGVEGESKILLLEVFVWNKNSKG